MVKGEVTNSKKTEAQKRFREADKRARVSIIMELIQPTTMKHYLYNPSTHCLDQQPTMMKTKDTGNFYLDKKILANYEAHLASLEKIPCQPGSSWPQGVIKEGEFVMRSLEKETQPGLWEIDMEAMVAVPYPAARRE